MSIRRLLVLTAGLSLLSAAPSPAQSSYELFPFTRQRATNVARMQAERLNGGLGVYRPAACMYERGGGDCLIKGSAEGYLFRFLGGAPGWQILGLPATRETEIEVSPDGRTVVKVVYNGAPRTPAPVPASPEADPSAPGARP
jgi:hypothetical protein